MKKRKKKKKRRPLIEGCHKRRESLHTCLLFSASSSVCTLSAIEDGENCLSRRDVLPLSFYRRSIWKQKNEFEIETPSHGERCPARGQRRNRCSNGLLLLLLLRLLIRNVDKETLSALLVHERWRKQKRRKVCVAENSFSRSSWLLSLHLLFGSSLKSLSACARLSFELYACRVISLVLCLLRSFFLFSSFLLWFLFSLSFSF